MRTAIAIAARYLGGRLTRSSVKPTDRPSARQRCGKGYLAPAAALASVLAMAGTFLMLALVGGTPAQAQEADLIEEITVTGSRIRRQDFTANSPITTVDATTFEETSTVGIETVLNQLPQFVPAVTQFTTGDVQNTATNTVGASTVSLRGLGSNRNLVLINGRRGQPVNAALVVDTNSIPAAAIQRVEVISGGASAVYGADAVGGVVNVILKDNFEGVSFDSRYGVTQEGDNAEYTVSALFGSSVADGRGNVMFGIEHSQRAKVRSVNRDWRVAELNHPNIPGTDFWFSETYISSHSPGNLPSQGAVDQLFSEVEPGAVPNNASLYINPTPDGSGTVFAGASAFAGASGAAGGYRYDGPMERPDHPGIAYRKFHPNGQITENALDSWSSIPLDRHSFFGRGVYDIADNIRAVIQGNFSRNRNETLLGFAGAALGGNNAQVPWGSDLYEPSLADDGVTTNPAYLPGGVYGLNCPPTGGCTKSQAFPLPPEMELLMLSRPNPDDDIRINRNLDFLGVRRSRTQTGTFQVLAGVEGELPNGWFWDASAAHGQTEYVVNFSGFTSMPRWREVVASPNFGRGFSRTGNELGAGRGAGTATCTTGMPVIADFEVSEDCKRAVQTNLQNNSQLEQNLIELNLTGTAAELPAGPLQFAVGAGWRDAIYSFQTDTSTTNESYIETTIGLFPTTNTFGKFDVRELYGELLIPVVADVPLVRRFNLELGGRVSDYSSVGRVETYKSLIDWTITDWARLRGGFQLANRAPNIGELFLSRTQVFGGTGGIYGDQCSENSLEGPFSANPNANINGAEGAAFTKALCEAMMGTTAADEYYGRAVEDQPETGGTGLPNTIGNPNLMSEEAETWTFGIVFNSPWDGPILSGFTGSVDWYEIEITDMIAVENADPVFQRCLDPNLNPDGDPTIRACQAFTRDPLNGGIVSLDLSYTNEGRALTSGMDVQLNWAGNFASRPGGINVNVLANYNLKNITQAAPEVAAVDWVGTRGCALQLQCMGYDYRVFTTFNYFRGPWNATVRWSHLPSIKAGAAATNPDTTAIGVRSSYDVFALTGSYRWNENVMFRLGIENLFNRKPPLAGGNPDASNYPLAPTRAGGAYYDPLGRRMFLGVSVEL